jgi:two-component system OmpR family response regulator
LRQFRWFSAGPVPAAYDLRRLGWQLLEEHRASASDKAYALLGRPKELPLAQWLKMAGSTSTERKWMMMLEVSDSGERARMLRLGFGDALDFGTSLEELEYRVMRLAHFAQSLPRYRYHGALQIDLLSREAFVAGRALGLHPREFALLWRLADTPGESVRHPRTGRLDCPQTSGGVLQRPSGLPPAGCSFPSPCCPGGCWSYRSLRTGP